MDGDMGSCCVWQPSKDSLAVTWSGTVPGLCSDSVTKQRHLAPFEVQNTSALHPMKPEQVNDHGGPVHFPQRPYEASTDVFHTRRSNVPTCSA